MSYLALAERDRDGVHPLPPAVGLVGAAGFFPLMLWNLYNREPQTFGMVVLIAVVVVAAETLYFERDVIKREVDEVERTVFGDGEGFPPDVDQD